MAPSEVFVDHRWPGACRRHPGRRHRPKGLFLLRGLIKAAGRVGAALNARDVETARGFTARHLVSRPLEDADETAIVSAAIESLSENFTDSVASPILWFAFGGLPAAWGYRFVNTADAMLGYRDGDREWGGKLAARFDDVLNWIPARLSAWVLVAASGLSGLESGRALRVMKEDALKCPSPNSGWTMAAAAGALGVRLEKNGEYTLNVQGRNPVPADLQRGITLILVSTLLLMPLAVLLGFILAPIASIIREARDDFHTRGNEKRKKFLCGPTGRGEGRARACRLFGHGSAGDEEMSERIRIHRAERPTSWRTCEEPRNPADVFASAAGAQTILLDCITSWLTNLIAPLGDEPNRSEVFQLGEMEVGRLLESILIWERGAVNA